MPSPRPHIVFSDTYGEEAVERARAAGRVTVLQSPTHAQLRAALADCDALVIRTATTVTRELIEAAPKLRVIGRGGVGLDNIDLEAAAQHSITVVHTPGAATESVADLTLGLMLALLRNLKDCDAQVRGGAWSEARTAIRLRELHDCTIGVVGMGRIGRAVAKRCRQGFGCRVLYNDIIDVGWLETVAEPAGKDELYAVADIVTLHVPLTDATRHLIDAGALAKFKPGAMLINTSRGPVVDGAALAAALHERRLAGAGLDVLDVEPPPADHPLLAAPNCLLTPHVGARSAAALARMDEVVDDVIRVLAGEMPHYAYTAAKEEKP